LLRQLRPSVVHAHAGVPAAAAAIARELSEARPRVIGQMYSWGLDRPEWMDVQDVWGLARADRVVCSARAYWDVLIARGVSTRRLVYLPWGLALDELPLRADADVSSRTSPILGFVGRIEPRKGQHDLVDVLSHVRREIPGARLELVGPIADDAYARDLTSAIRVRRLEDAVTLHDRVPSILPFLRRWDVFVSMSSDEGQGLAVLEAMAVGVPVVARRVRGIEDFVIDAETGVSVTSASAAVAARAVRRVLSDHTLRETVIRSARRIVERNYSWERMLRRFERLYTGH
jgi:glycosyltransferase involved in cell wall biosynthesis